LCILAEVLHVMSDEGVHTDNPLDDIFVDGDQMDRVLVASILESYMAIDGEDGEVYTKEAYGASIPKDKFRLC